jgi:signal transduction histidine kinase
LDSRRVQDPSLRIGHNQIAGFVTVESQSGSHLVERSSREGFEDNAAFRRLRRLIIQLFAEVVEPRRQNFRAGARLSRQRRTPFEQLDELSELKGMRRILTDLPAAKRASAEKAISEETAKIQQQIEELKERQRVLEAKSSLGLIVGEILHEGAPEANFLAVSSSRLLSAWKLLFLTGPKSDEARDDYPERLRLMAESGGRLRSLFVNLRPLSGGRRTSPQSFNVMNVIKDTASFFDTHNVEFEMHGAGQLTELFGHKEDLATALLNLISNAIFWLENSQTTEPKIRIRVTWVGSDEVAITIEDNGPGVPEEFAERIFDLKFTLKESGTGLGLNIAQEALARSGGRLLFHPEFPEGAKFEIRFPRYKGEG